MAGQARLRLFYESMKAEKVAERQLIRKNKAVPFTYRDVSVEHEVVGDNLSTLITDLKKDCEGSPPDVEDERFHTKRSRLLFQRRMLVRKMGWLENNAYLTRLALEAKAEKHKGRDEKRIMANTFHPRVIPPYPKKREPANAAAKE